MITFVKVKEKNMDVRFEILTRCAFNGYDLTMTRDKFDSIFRFSEENAIVTNIIYSKDDVYECLDKTFMQKMDWWNENINAVDRLHKKIYHSDKPSIEDSFSLQEIRESYASIFGGNSFDFMVDYTAHKNLFDSAVKAQENVYDEAGV